MYWIKLNLTKKQKTKQKQWRAKNVRKTRSGNQKKIQITIIQPSASTTFKHTATQQPQLEKEHTHFFVQKFINKIKLALNWKMEKKRLLRTITRYKRICLIGICFYFCLFTNINIRIDQHTHTQQKKTIIRTINLNKSELSIIIDKINAAFCFIYFLWAPIFSVISIWSIGFKTSFHWRFPFLKWKINFLACFFFLF